MQLEDFIWIDHQRKAIDLSCDDDLSETHVYLILLQIHEQLLSVQNNQYHNDESKIEESKPRDN